MIGEIVLASILAVISAVWIYIGIFQLGLWVPGVKASSGFIPTVFATLTLFFCIIMIISAIRKRNKVDATTVAVDEKEKSDKKKAEQLTTMSAFIPVLFGLVGIIIFKLFGVVIFTFTITFTWLQFISRKGWKKSLVIACAVTLFIYLVFELWLSIPFPGQIIRL